MPKTLVVITGPTGIGKTAVSIQIARYFNTQIVSSDSRQIFKELRIGTAIPSENELQAVPHHFIQTHSILDNYNASLYEKEALQKLEQLFQEEDIVLLVGGSMMYIDAVCKGIDQIPDADPEIRLTLKKQLEEEGIEILRRQLKKLDQKYYNKVDLKNPARIIHALEISLTTGKPYSSFLTNKEKNRPFEIIYIGLNTDREKLHRRINQRVDKMIKNGLEEEARSVYAYKHLVALNTVGYREIFNYFDGEITRGKAIELIKRNSRRYARKQITWFRRNENMRWFEPQQSNEIIQYINEQIRK